MTRAWRDKLKNLLIKLSIINISINTHENNSCLVVKLVTQRT